MGDETEHGSARPRVTLLGTLAAGSDRVPCLPGSGVRSGASPAAGLRVAVLGPLVISGGAGELQPRQAELVGALALAGRDGLSADVLRTRLGTDPDHPKDAVLLRQVITRTRRRLGTTPAGGEYIVYDECSARYRLDAAVRVDLDEFRALVGSGRAAGDPRPLWEAVALLRGHPLDGLFWWWLDAAMVERVRVEAVDAAVLLARLALEAGDPVTARRAALAGLAVDPAAEELWRQLMLAEDVAGNMAGVQRAWAKCRAAIADVAVGGEPHPVTAALYRSLSSCRARPAVVPRVYGAEARLLGERSTQVRAAG